MKEVELISMLGRIGVEHIDSPKPGQLYVQCPFARWMHPSGTDNKPSMGIKYDKVPGIFHCFTCHESGKLWSLFDTYGRLSKQDEFIRLGEHLLEYDQPTLRQQLEAATDGLEEWRQVERSGRMATLSEDILSHFTPLEFATRAQTYLLERRFTIDAGVEAGLVYDSTNNRLVFPVRNFDGELVGAVGRTIEGRGPKYYNYFGFEKAKCFGGMHWFNKDKPRIIIVEGFFCLMRTLARAHAVNANAFCAFGAKLSTEQCEILANLDYPTSLWFDNDEAGNKGWEKAKEELGPLLSSLRKAVLPVHKDADTISDIEFREVFSHLTMSAF